MKRSLSLLLAAAAVSEAVVSGNATAAPVGRNGSIWRTAESLRSEQLALIERLVNIDSGTGDKVSGQKAQDVVAEQLRALGMNVTAVPAEMPDFPDNLVASLKGRGKGRLLLIAHTDTVFESGTAVKRPFRTDATRAYGPGVADEKGGVVEAIMAIKLLKTLKIDSFASITVLVETSEERGSPGTRALIACLVSEADVELNMEPGDSPDTLTVWRKGSTAFKIAVKGRPAHAGVAPQDGRNAALELIHQIEQVGNLPKSGDGMTANLTLMKAGSRYNIIPEDASATINVRVREKRQAQEVDALLQANARKTLIPDTTVTVSHETSFPPLPSNGRTDALAAIAERIYGEVGMNIRRGGNGGASESALAFEGGIATLDGLGPVGGGFHSEQEFLELASLTPRLYLLARLIMETGSNPSLSSK